MNKLLKKVKVNTGQTTCLPYQEHQLKSVPCFYTVNWTKGIAWMEWRLGLNNNKVKEEYDYILLIRSSD